MTDKAKILMEALRCSASAEAACKKEACPYYSQVSAVAREEFCKETKLDMQQVPEDFWCYCDAERIAMEAASMIEELRKR